MRALAVVVVMLAAAACVQREDSRDTECTMVSSLARSVMKSRQDGANMAEMMEGANEVLRRLAVEAYSQPRYSSPEYIQKAIDDFSNDAYLACVK